MIVFLLWPIQGYSVEAAGALINIHPHSHSNTESFNGVISLPSRGVP